VPEFTGLKASQDGRAVARWPEIKRTPNTGTMGLELEPIGIRTGSNSGYQAINLAVLLGARRIVLLGYDMKVGPRSQRHWFGDHPAELNKDSNYGLWIELFESMLPTLEATGIEVLNCTPGSALRCFTSTSLDAALGGANAVR
jgi:hypothetical protein